MREQDDAIRDQSSEFLGVAEMSRLENDGRLLRRGID
jgi:hypothetical protein